MKNNFNLFERDILNWIKSKCKNTELSAQIDAAEFINREWTKVGFYVKLKIPRNIKAINSLNIKWPISGPMIKSNGIQHDGGSLLWGEDGYIDCLELYANGDYFKENVIKYELFELNENKSSELKSK